jgi:hypothetical protein
MDFNTKGGFLDNLIKKGKLPEVEVTFARQAIIEFGVMFLVLIVVFILLSVLAKAATR